MIIYKARPVARAVAVLAAGSLFLTACGAGGGNDDGDGGGSAAEVEGDTTGITDTSIKIGTHMPLTGRAAPGYSTIPQGARAYFEQVNANGGICDREIEYVVENDEYIPSNTDAVTKKLVLQEEIFAMLGGLGTPTHRTVVPFLNEQEVPDLFVSSGALQWNNPEENPYTFGWQPNYTVEGKVMGQYIADNFPDAKVGLFLQGDDFGEDGAKGVNQVIEDQVVAEAKYDPTNPESIAPAIGQLQQAGADTVVMFSVPAFTALANLASLRLNYKPQLFISNVGSDASLVGALIANFSKGAVQGAGALEGVYTNKYIPTVEEPDDPWIQLFTQVWEEHGENDEPLNNFRVYGMAQAYTLVSALARTCDNLNRQALVATLEEEGSEMTGPWLAPLEYSEDSHRGITGVQVVKIEGGKPVQQTEVQTTDDGDGALEEYTEGSGEVPENGVPTAE
ncbi:MAG TPA: ABC transporter substrate-binding protein [Mycobacteriales bacterium]|nr:ABC transporter substrate-binding protein [Mycobacteriales bacterium]